MGPIIAVKDELFKTFRLACIALPKVVVGGPARSFAMPVHIFSH